MLRYLVQISFEPDAADARSAFGDPAEAVRPTAERFGGRVEGGWLSGGDQDIVAVVDVPVLLAQEQISEALAACYGVRAVAAERFKPPEPVSMECCVHGLPTA